MNGLSAPYLSQCAVVTDFATTVEGDAFIFLVLVVVVHVRSPGQVQYEKREKGEN